MPRVKLTQPLRINLTGYDRHPAEFEAGEQNVPERVATFVAAHPEFGEVLAGKSEATSLSDQQIELVEALREGIPGLQPKPAAALVAAGFETPEAVFIAGDEELREIDGVADGTINAIEAARSAPHLEPDATDAGDSADSADSEDTGDDAEDDGA